MEKQRLFAELENGDFLTVEYGIENAVFQNKDIAKIKTSFKCVALSATVVQGGNVVKLDKSVLNSLNSLFKDIDKLEVTKSINIDV